MHQFTKIQSACITRLFLRHYHQSQSHNMYIAKSFNHSSLRISNLGSPTIIRQPYFLNQTKNIVLCKSHKRESPLNSIFAQWCYCHLTKNSCQHLLCANLTFHVCKYVADMDIHISKSDGSVITCHTEKILKSM